MRSRYNHHKHHSHSNFSRDDEQFTLKAKAILTVTLVSPVTLFILVSNFAVLFVILRRRILKKLRNMPLLSLAMADLMVGVFLGPLLIATHLLPEDRIVCMMHLIAEKFCYTASLLNMFIVSVERWIAIFQPLRYSRIVNPTSVWVTILSSWILALVIALSRICLRCKMARHSCAWTRKGKGVFPILFCVIFLVLMLVMGIMQLKIYKVVRAHRRQIAPRAVQSSGRTTIHVEHSRGNAPPSVTADANQGIATIADFTNDAKTAQCSSPVRRFELRSSESSNQVRGIIKIQVKKSTPTSTACHSNSPSQSPAEEPDICLEMLSIGQIAAATNHLSPLGMNDKAESVLRKAARARVSVVSTDADHSRHTIEASADSSARAATNSQRTHSTSQQTVTSAVSMLYLIFILIWLPYIVFTILRSLKICRGACAVGNSIAQLLILFNSAINPLIYTLRVKVFRNAIKQLVVCRKHRKVLRSEFN